MEKLTEDENGFFKDLVNGFTENISRRKHKREAHHYEFDLQQTNDEEDKSTRKARADEARRQIAAKVIARASPREVQQAIKKARKKETLQLNGKSETVGKTGCINEKLGDIFRQRKRYRKQ